MNISEENLRKINESKMAQLASDYMDTVFKAFEEEAINRMKMAYRGGTITQANFMGFCAELCALDAMRQSLKSTIRVGQTIQKKINMGEEENGK